MELKNCPVATALSHIGGKWSINIIRDLMLGKKRFKDFLNENQNLSTKMLSKRLKDLEREGIIEKNIISKNPVLIEYSLTEKGKSLNTVLYDLALFSVKYYSKEVSGISCQYQKKDVNELKKMFGVE